jgi:hypothetical protein
MKSDGEIDRDRQFDEMTDDSMKFVEILTQHLLPCGDDLTLLTLKGHLIVEYLLETILLRLLGIPEAPKRLGRRKSSDKIMPGFYEKLKLVEAAVCQSHPGPNADLLIVIENLNWMRNQLAHNLKNQADKLNARAALAASGALPENVNYAVKSSYLLSFLESVPDVANKLKEARTAERKFEDVVIDAEQSAVLVLVY